MSPVHKPNQPPPQAAPLSVYNTPLSTSQTQKHTHTQQYILPQQQQQQYPHSYSHAHSQTHTQSGNFNVNTNYSSQQPRRVSLNIKVHPPDLQQTALLPHTRLSGTGGLHTPEKEFFFQFSPPTASVSVPRNPNNQRTSNTTKRRPRISRAKTIPMPRPPSGKSIRMPRHPNPSSFQLLGISPITQPSSAQYASTNYSTHYTLGVANVSPQSSKPSSPVPHNLLGTSYQSSENTETRSRGLCSISITCMYLCVCLVYSIPPSF